MNLANEFEKLKNLRDSGAITQEEFDRSKNRLLDAAVRRIEAFDERKPAPWSGWGLPPVKVVRGVVRSIRFSPGQDGDKYAAFLNVDGRQAEISSASPICIDAGDQVTLGGYEHDGRLLALAYHNESAGTYSDLSRLRKGYRFLLLVGLPSMLAGVLATVGTMVVPLLRTRIEGLSAISWQYAPYVLACFVAAGISYFGLNLSFLGTRAKEFYDAMNYSSLHAADRL